MANFREQGLFLMALSTSHGYFVLTFDYSRSGIFPRLRTGAVHLVATLFRFTHKAAGKVLRNGSHPISHLVSRVICRNLVVTLMLAHSSDGFLIRLFPLTVFYGKTSGIGVRLEMVGFLLVV